MKVTPRRLKLVAFYQTVKMAPIVLRTTYHRFLSELLEAFIRNPDIKW